MCMTDAGTTQDYFILPAPPVGGLPISQDWLDRMKLFATSSKNMSDFFISVCLSINRLLYEAG